MDDLGQRIWLLALSLQGSKSEEEWGTLVWDAVKLLEMDPVGQPEFRHYPIGGKGGTGMTIFQPITESFLALDTWPDFDGAYLLVNSCKKFDDRQLVHWLEVDQGLVVIDTMSGSLGLACAVS